MKFKNIIIISLLLFVFSVAAVSGADDNNMTLNGVDSSQEQVSVSIEEISSDIISAPVDEKTLPDISFGSYGGQHFVGDEPNIWIEFKNEDISGTVAVQVDGIEKINKTALKGDVIFNFDEYGKDLKFNTPYNISLLYSGDSKYAAWNVSELCLFNYLKFDGDNSLDNVNVGVQQWSTTYLLSDAKGSVSLFVDDLLYDSVSVKDGFAYIWLKDFTYGLHNYTFAYSGDKKYPTQNASGIFNVSYLLDVGLKDGEKFLWGEEVNIYIMTPGVCDEIILNQNGDVKKIALVDGCADYTLKDLKFGENVLVFMYEGDSKYPARNITRTIYVTENIECPQEVRYKSGDGISVKLPSDAKGSIAIFEKGTEISRSPFIDGTAKVDLSALSMGNHTISVKYIGTDYVIGSHSFNFAVIPYVNYTKSINIHEKNTLSIILPQDADGYATLKYQDVVMANKSITGGKAVFDLGFLKVGEDKKLEIDYVSTKYGNYASNETINVRDESRDCNLLIYARDILVYDSVRPVSFEVGYGAGGTVTVNIGSKTFNLAVNDGFAVISTDYLVDGLFFGNYKLSVAYSGDEYYNPVSNSTNVKVGYVSFSVPQIVEIGKSDYIFILFAEDAYSEVDLYINGKYVKTAQPDDILPDEYAAIIDLSDLDFGVYDDVEVVYKGNGYYPKYSQKYSFTVISSIDVAGDEFAYGDSISVVISSFGNLNGEGILTVDGKNYTVQLKNGKAIIEIPPLEIGNYEVEFLYKGDSIFPKQISYGEIDVVGKIKYHDQYYISDDMNVSIMLPGDAKGNLTIIVKDESNNVLFIKNSAVKDGIASIPINELKLGKYHLYATYTGNDYTVTEVDINIEVSLKVNASDLAVDKDNDVIIEAPANSTGSVRVIVENDDYVVILNKTYQIVDGKVILSLKGYQAGSYDLNIIYSNPVYGNVSLKKPVYISNRIADVSVSIPDEIIVNDITTVTFTLPKDATGIVWVELNGEYFYGNVKDGKASVNVIPSASGIKLMDYGWEGNSKYEAWSNYTYVRVLKAPTLKASDLKMYYCDGSYFKLTVYDSFGKLAAGKYVTFYIDGKKFKSIKTDKNGVAKFKVSLTPKTYKVTAKYRGASITKKITVKQVLALKTVRVKKSAKKLVLTATLKQGKKAIKNKVLTFKFYGKTYKAKTNKYGVAKVTINKNVLKKLKVGKKVTYQVKYVSDIVKKIAKVIK